MARMYSRRRGKSGSKKPANLKAPWVKYKEKEIEELVVKLAKKGNPYAKMGLILRDKYGIPTVRINKTRISQIVEKHKLKPKLPDDMMNLMKKAVNLHGHMDKNKKDYTSKRGLALTESKIRRLAKYYIKNSQLPVDWKYNIDKAKLLVK
jgi:small subunit ribosomal protein S15